MIKPSCILGMRISGMSYQRTEAEGTSTDIMGCNNTIFTEVSLPGIVQAVQV